MEDFPPEDIPGTIAYMAPEMFAGEPGNEQTEYFGSQSADREGSRNYGAIRDPAVDKISFTGSSAAGRTAICRQCLGKFRDRQAGHLLL